MQPPAQWPSTLSVSQILSCSIFFQCSTLFDCVKNLKPLKIAFVDEVSKLVAGYGRLVEVRGWWVFVILLWTLDIFIYQMPFCQKVSNN